MFPLDFPQRVIAEYHEPNTAILDPFCGRGTSLFAARKSGIYSIGIDSSPVAAAIARSKVLCTTPEKILLVAKRILSSNKNPQVPVGEFWEYAYHPETLYSICKLRESLLNNCSTPERQALCAILLGALHGPLSQHGTSYLSNQCPRTYSPKPNYSIKFWKDRGMTPPKVDVLDIISLRANRYFPSIYEPYTGLVLKEDSTKPKVFKKISSNIAKVNTALGLIITSPPYYGMRTYIPDQWLRNWFVGGLPIVDYSTSSQISHSGIDMFVNELKTVWLHCATITARNGKIAVRFGAINDRVVDPETIIRRSFDDTPWSIIKVDQAGIPSQKSRQLNSFSKVKSPKAQIEEIDIIAELR